MGSRRWVRNFESAKNSFNLFSKHILKLASQCLLHWLQSVNFFTQVVQSKIKITLPAPIEEETLSTSATVTQKSLTTNITI